MELNKAMGKAIRRVREARLLTQEDFSEVSSRTYISSLERGLKSPTLKKIDELGQHMNVHPLTLILLAYVELEQRDSARSLFELSLAELADLLGSDG
ncbi:helix-turn-helix domain-containing protein [Marinospirillum alkaliphilum]|uniref:Helix-turn-helix n=1 Tax=Marinospirillum alkaliphilum DSM 21637 TaxID=1122209 RepID=A0A1K1YM58_9GAMM|nr:helix-turn-helix transcriptional regulator [Marinospirillum alkaliphilum]SFX63066.1 Helix-turn-helix [Marinospirillum alkaliphilum DSM 21637]